MDQYVTTYRKDYLWPYVRTFPLRGGPTYATILPPSGAPCGCKTGPGGEMPPTEKAGPAESDSYEWSRLGPMGPLLDPKLYPAKLGASPESENLTFNQPNTYLKKLHEKYPYLYNVLQSAPPDDMLKRINVDRLRTTYQMDYGHMGEHPSADYDNLLSAAGVGAPEPCAPPTQLPGVDCRPHIRPPALKSQAASKYIAASRKREAEEAEAGPRVAIPAWISEYQDVIGRTGRVIFREKLHQHGARSWGKAFGRANPRP